MKRIKNAVGKVRDLAASKEARLIGRMIVISLILGFVLTNRDGFNQFNDVGLVMDIQDTGSGEIVYASEYESKGEVLDIIEISTKQYIDSSKLNVRLMQHGKDVLPSNLKIKISYNSSTQYTYHISTDTQLEHKQKYQLLLMYQDGMEAIDFNEVNLSLHTFPALLYAVMMILLVGLSVGWMVQGIQRKSTIVIKKRIDPMNFIFCFINAVVVFVIVELLYNDNIWKLDIFTMFGGVVCYFLFIIALTMLFNSQRWGNIVGILLGSVLGFANHYVCEFRSQPIQPNDISNIGTASDVAGQYQYDSVESLMIVVSLIFIVALALLIVPEQKYGFTWKGKLCVRGAGVAVTLLATAFLMSDAFMDRFDVEIYQFSPMVSYKQNSFPLSFFSLAGNLKVEKPKGYSTAKVNAMSDELDEKNHNKEQTKPNIVVVMNESLADPSYINPFSTTEDYMPFWNSLQEDTIKGHTLVSVYGGTTANSEYEFLTGNSIEQFKVQVVPYMTNITGKTYSMAWTLKNQGYKTTAMHPYTAANWKRDKVYSYLGFDEYDSIDDFENAEYLRNYMSDKSDYDNVLRVLSEETDDPQFIFNVTMQNHSPYLENWCPVTVATTDVSYGDVDQYLSLVKESDAALQYLVESLRNFSEPTILVMFGDHYPALDTEFYDWLYGKNESQLTLEEIQKKYATPFLIWANYDIPEYSDVITSTNYLSSMTLQQAGVEMTNYNRFLLNMRNSIPAMNVNGYLGADGVYYSYDDESDYTDLIETYDNLQYNGLIDTKKRVDSMFFRKQE